MSSTLIRCLTAALAATLVLLALGAGYQRYAEAKDRRIAPPPGRMVQAAGQEMHIYCIGEMRPTVILEADVAEIAQSWALVQASLSGITRVCAYDRPGSGWSEPASLGSDGEALAAALHQLLAATGEVGPYVKVGHGFGGARVRHFALRYPADVADLALLDPAHEGEPTRMPAEARDFHRQRLRSLSRARLLSSTGLLRAYDAYARDPDSLPELDSRSLRMFQASGAHLTAARAELRGGEAIMGPLRRDWRPGGLPLLVVTPAVANAAPSAAASAKLRLHRELAGTSARGDHQALSIADSGSLLTDRQHARDLASLLAGFLTRFPPPAATAWQ